MVRYADIVYSLQAKVRMEERAIPDRSHLDGDEPVAGRVLADGKPWKVVYVGEQQGTDPMDRVVPVTRIRGLGAPRTSRSTRRSSPSLSGSLPDGWPTPSS